MFKRKIQERILRTLMEFKPAKWGGCHTAERNMLKKLPRHLVGEKMVRKAVKELYSLGFIIKLRKTNEWHVSLNSRKNREIYEFLNISHHYDTMLYHNRNFYKR